ncbi:hypothetical protein C5O75_000590 [Burkholderia cepacia]|uniref:hypothetical protein n=1 Tax=Burkholderia cepacia TaxID=292 RepID=UPI000CF0D9CB|nr:hypothetical protein [Burkholderia cepacia]KAB1597431.1 hypothetical protein C5O75_000590 [Burkholderia cepacia]
MILKFIESSRKVRCAHALCMLLLVSGPALGGAWSIPVDDELACAEVRIVQEITLSGTYSIDYDDEFNGSEVWFVEDGASASQLPDRSQRAGLIVFSNQQDALRYLRLPIAQPDGVCRVNGRATIVISDLETVCPGQEATDRAILKRVVSAGSPTQSPCDAATR